jgi:cell division protein FtsW
MPRRRAFDRWLFVTAVLFALGGIFMVGSASHYIAMSQGKDPTYFLVRQCLFLGVGALLMAGAMRVPLSWLDDRRLVYGLVALSAVLLLAVLATPSSQGAHRWFRVGPFGVQPSELAKVTSVILLAHVLSRRTAEQVNDLRQTLLPVVGIIGLLAMLIVIEPDLGSAVILLSTAATLLFVAGLRWRYIGATAAAGASSSSARSSLSRTASSGSRRSSIRERTRRAPGSSSPSRSSPSEAAACGGSASDRDSRRRTTCRPRTHRLHLLGDR